MDYLNTFLLGIAVGLSFNYLLPVYFARWREKVAAMSANSNPGDHLATKDEIKHLEKEIAELKTMHKDTFDQEAAAAEFYDENGIE